MKPKFLATAIGSLPYENEDAAVELIIKNLPEAPIWPQLPKLSLYEQMEIQYSEGIPNVVIDQEKHRIYFDTASDYSEAFADFYEKYLMAMDTDTGNGDCASMAISPSFSKGIVALEKKLKTLDKKLPFIKVQTTGPCSFALTIVDENKRAIYYNEEFRDVIVKALAMKCRWQIQKFQKYAEKVICFIDEPILSAFGSSTYVSVRREDIIALLKEVIEAIHADGGIAGAHCCGNTEWSILSDAGVDIINCDAYAYGETILYYADAMKAHLERGGMIAWGIVPTNTKIRENTIESLTGKLEALFDGLASKGIDKGLIAEQAIITPSCGTGTMELPDAVKVFEMTGELSKSLKAKYGF
jgi:hypothetical protein